MRRVHAEIEVLYGTLYQPACENAAGRDAFNGRGEPEMTTEDARVSCRRCREALGYRRAA